MEKLSKDVTIIGGGVAGLMASYKLSGLGLDVILLEKNDSFAQGPSTRNEGWLHNGTYHSNSISNVKNATDVARRCIYGHKQIREFVPEAIEEPDKKTIALLKEEESYKELLDRWNQAGVKYKEINLNFLSKMVPEVKKNYISKAFEVGDVGINTRIFYAKLLHQAKLNGTNFFTGAEIDFIDNENAFLQSNQGKFSLESKIFLYTSGYSNSEIIKKNFGIELPIRYWKSHLINTPRITDIGTFLLDPEEVGMMNHENISVVGFNEDAVLTQEPNFEIIPEKINLLLDKLHKAYKLPENLKYAPLACLKIDVPNEINVKRDLNISVIEPLEKHICAFPGKMTETPFLTDFLVKYVYERISEEPSSIAFRPCDIVKNKLLCKQGIEVEGEIVIKKHKTYGLGSLEKKISSIYSSSEISEIVTPEHKGVYYREGKIVSFSEKLNLKNLLGNSDVKISEKLVSDLALFHEMFTKNPEIDSSCVLYRDAIKSNYLIDNDRIIHIDFTSSNIFVHAFDDLALLLNSNWGKLPEEEIPNLLNLYIDKRKEFRKKGAYSLDKLNEEEINLLGNSQLSERKSYYINKISEMNKVLQRNYNLKSDILKANFEEIDHNDFDIFNRFRDIRAEYYIKHVWFSKNNLEQEIA